MVKASDTQPASTASARWAGVSELNSRSILFRVTMLACSMRWPNGLCSAEAREYGVDKRRLLAADGRLGWEARAHGGSCSSSERVEDECEWWRDSVGEDDELEAGDTGMESA
jgi:hypothetical protein